MRYIHAFGREPKTMIKAPEDECITSSVPEPTKKEYNEKITIGDFRTDPIAAERYVDVITEPA